MIPWRVKNFLSGHFPLLYHLAVNPGNEGQQPRALVARLAERWDAPGREWPTKNELIASLTSPSEMILDIGCGNCGILRDLKGRGYQHLHGLEISDYAIRRLSV